MVTIIPDTPTSTEDTVEAFATRMTSPRMPEDKAPLSVGVIVLDAEFDDAKVAARGPCESTTHRGKDARRAKAAECVYGPKRNVHGMRGAVQRPHVVRHARPAARSGFASSATAAAAPRAG